MSKFEYIIQYELFFLGLSFNRYENIYMSYVIIFIITNHDN